MWRLSRIALTVVIPLVFAAVACDSSDVRDERDPPVSPSEPESLVDLEAVGGIAGATWYDLSVRVDQSVIVKLYDPPVRGGIATSRFDRLRSELEAFEWLDDEYLTGGCADDVWYSITVYGTTAKTVETRDCTFILNGDNPDVVYLRALIDTLASIQSTIVRDFAPWRAQPMSSNSMRPGILSPIPFCSPLQSAILRQRLGLYTSRTVNTSASGFLTGKRLTTSIIPRDDLRSSL